MPVSLPGFAYGAKLAPIVSSAKAAMVICKMWDRKYHRVPDLVVIEGPKAGGHLGFSREELDRYTDQSYDEEILKIFEVVKNLKKNMKLQFQSQLQEEFITKKKQITILRWEPMQFKLQHDL